MRALGGPAFTGKLLMDYMTNRLGWPGLDNKTVLDVGCGSRFAATIHTYDVPVGRYIGIDVDREMIDWLQQNAAAPNIEFHWIDQSNPMYNPNGTASNPHWPFVAGADLCCMFSVITHQLPQAAAGLFREAHRRTARDGVLFFTAHIHGDEGDYQELGPAPTNLSSYSEASLRALLAEAGWAIASIQPRSPQLSELPGTVPIAENLVCRKA